jgi:hypothetical protein
MKAPSLLCVLLKLEFMSHLSHFYIHSLNSSASFHTRKGIWAFHPLGRGAMPHLQPHSQPSKITWRTALQSEVPVWHLAEAGHLKGQLW